jgi:hypothetical protein
MAGKGEKPFDRPFFYHPVWKQFLQRLNFLPYTARLFDTLAADDAAFLFWAIMG